MGTTRRFESMLKLVIPIAAAVLRTAGSDGIYLFAGSAGTASVSRFDSSSCSSFGLLMKVAWVLTMALTNLKRTAKL